jgi:hypothetical protein
MPDLYALEEMKKITLLVVYAHFISTPTAFSIYQLRGAANFPLLEQACSNLGMKVFHGWKVHREIERRRC